MIPTIRKTPLRLTSEGYLRQLGPLRKGGSVAKFYLGYDMAIAAQRRQWIEHIYVENCRLNGHKIWSDPYLNFARQIERVGSAVYQVEKLPPELSHMGSDRDFSFIQRLRDLGIPISIQGETAHAKVALASDVTPQGKPAITKLHDAIKRYKKERVKDYAGGFQGAQRLDRQIEKFLDIEDCWLHELGFVKIKSFVDYWRKRPRTAHNKQCSKKYAENQIGEFYNFLAVIEATYPNEFECPNLSSINRSVIKLASDAKGNAIRDLSWTPDELREAFKHAEPMAQLIIGLGLNACSGAAELGRIKVTDFHFDCKHPHHKIVRYNGTHDWLITTRRKQWTHSEALLWPWVSELVQQQIEICNANGWPYLFTEHGEPMYRDNDIYEELGLEPPNTTKPECRFVKRYDSPVHAAFKAKLIPKKRSLGKLRKTFSNYLTLEDHADLATLALAHQTDEDQLLKHYANKPYKRLFIATVAAADEWCLPKSQPRQASSN